MKNFIDHAFAMGLVRKSNMEKYWSRNEIMETPFFGKYVVTSI